MIRDRAGWGWRRRRHLGQVAVVRNDHAGFPLDGLHHEGHDVGVSRQPLLERLDVVVRDLAGQSIWPGFMRSGVVEAAERTRKAVDYTR